MQECQSRPLEKQTNQAGRYLRMNTEDQSILEKDLSLIQMMEEARDNIPWELESPPCVCIGLNSKIALHYFSECKKWGIRWTYTNPGEVVPDALIWQYYDKYKDGVQAFNSLAKKWSVDLSQVKRIKTDFHSL